MFQVKLILFVSLGFCELLRWPLTNDSTIAGGEWCNWQFLDNSILFHSFRVEMIDFR